MLDIPFYTARFVEARVPDPLGTASPNETIYRTTLPGLNNVVRFVRVYSAICWMVRQIEKEVQRHRNADVGEISRMGLEKIQLLLTWYNKEVNLLNGLAGGNRPYPKDNRKVALRFESFGAPVDGDDDDDENYEGGSNVSYLQAVQYQPSIVNGLRFLSSTNVPGAYQLTEHGDALADAYELAIENHPWRNWLSNLSKLTVTRNDVIEKMGGLLDLTKPSKKEAREFLARFYPAPGSVLDLPNWRNRYAGLTLALRALQAEQSRATRIGESGVHVDAVRFAMARGCAQDGTPFARDGVEQVMDWWKTLQLRQYLRLSLDVLLRCTEGWILDATNHSHERHVSDCASGLGQTLLSTLPADQRPRVRDLADSIRATQKHYPTLFAAGPYMPQERRLERLFAILASLAKFRRHSDDEALALRQAYLALVYVGVEAANFENIGLKAIDSGSERISLARIRHQVDEFADASPAEFFAEMVKSNVLHQHFRVAQERNNDGRSRFRVFPGEVGLERRVNGPQLFEPRVLADRLHHALLLLEQCGMVQKLNYYQFVLTAAGRNRIERG